MIIGFLGLLEVFPDERSYDSADYRCDDEQPQLIKRRAADEQGWSKASSWVH